MPNTPPIDQIALIEDRLNIFCFNDDQMAHQVQTNIWATLLSNDAKCARFEGLSMKIRRYVNSFRLQKQNYCFFCNGDDYATYNRVKNEIMHLLGKMEMNIVFEASQSQQSSATLITMLPEHWANMGMPEKVALSMLETIETGLANSATSALFVLDYDKSTPLLRSFIETVMANPNIAVYLFQDLPENSLNSPEHMQQITSSMRSRNIECYALDSSINFKKFEGVEYV
ncbi:hypothetical protein ACVP6W_002266 [Vibrio cholerae]